jgi:hypothetical protein
MRLFLYASHSSLILRRAIRPVSKDEASIRGENA